MRPWVQLLDLDELPAPHDAVHDGEPTAHEEGDQDGDLDPHQVREVPNSQAAPRTGAPEHVVGTQQRDHGNHGRNGCREGPHGDLHGAQFEVRGEDAARHSEEEGEAQDPCGPQHEAEVRVLAPPVRREDIRQQDFEARDDDQYHQYDNA
eukprot:UN3221